MRFLLICDSWHSFSMGRELVCTQGPLCLPKLVHHVDIPHNLVMHDLWQEFSLVPSANFTLSPESCVLTLV